MDLSCSVDECNGVTLVHLDVGNPTRVARRVRIESRHEGSILPPRHHGTPVTGWDEDGVTVTLRAGERRGLGFATRTSPETPAAEIVGSEPTGPESDSTRSAGDVLAALGDPRPPRDTGEEGVPRSGGQDGAVRNTTSPTDGEHCVPPSDRSAAEEVPVVTAPVRTPVALPDEENREPEGSSQAGDEDSVADVPPAIAAWLDRVDTRRAAGNAIDVAVLNAISQRAAIIARRADR
jgi:hypothetical protein